MTITDFLSRLDGVRSRGNGRYTAKCPAHADRSPSLSIREVGPRILLRCFAGCETSHIMTAIGLTMADLFCDGPIKPGQRPRAPLPNIDLDHLAFQFDLAALDRRLRAERVVQALRLTDMQGLSDHDRRRLTNTQRSAEADNERAHLLEQVADDLRWRAFVARERISHAA